MKEYHILEIINQKFDDWKRLLVHTNQVTFGKSNKLCLEDSIIKIIEDKIVLKEII